MRFESHTGFELATVWATNHSPLPEVPSKVLKHGRLLSSFPTH